MNVSLNDVQLLVLYCYLRIVFHPRNTEMLISGGCMVQSKGHKCAKTWRVPCNDEVEKRLEDLE